METAFILTVQDAVVFTVGVAMGIILTYVFLGKDVNEY